MMIKTCSLAIVLGLAASQMTHASGTYMPKGGRVPSAGETKMDSAKYALGQKTFEGKMTSPGAGNAKSQKPKLMAIQSSLPMEKSKAMNLVKLAGNITDEQVMALDYYVATRFSK